MTAWQGRSRARGLQLPPHGVHDVLHTCQEVPAAPAVSSVLAWPHKLLVVLLLLLLCRLVEGRSSCALWHAWAMTESRLGDPSAVRYLFKRALQANPRSRYTHLAWAMWEREQVRAWIGCACVCARVCVWGGEGHGTSTALRFCAF